MACLSELSQALLAHNLFRAPYRHLICSSVRFIYLLKKSLHLHYRKLDSSRHPNIMGNLKSCFPLLTVTQQNCTTVSWIIMSSKKMKLHTGCLGDENSNWCSHWQFILADCWLIYSSEKARSCFYDATSRHSFNSLDRITHIYKHWSCSRYVERKIIDI